MVIKVVTLRKIEMFKLNNIEDIRIDKCTIFKENHELLAGDLMNCLQKKKPNAFKENTGNDLSSPKKNI